MLIDRLMQLIVFTQIVFRITANMQSSLVLTTEKKKKYASYVVICLGNNNYWSRKLLCQEANQHQRKERNEACMANHVLWLSIKVFSHIARRKHRRFSDIVFDQFLETLRKYLSI